jgi:DNA primase
MREHDISRPAGKVETLNSILPFLSKMRDKIERATYAEQIADRLKIEGRVIREELKRAAVGKLPQLDLGKVAPAIRVLPAEKQLLKILFFDESLRYSMLPLLKNELFKDLATESIFTALVSLTKSNKEVDFTTLCAEIEPNRLAQSEKIISEIMVEIDTLSNLSADELTGYAQEAFNALRRLQIEQQLVRLQGELNEAQRDGNNNEVTELLLKKFALAQEMKQLLGK